MNKNDLKKPIIYSDINKGYKMKTILKYTTLFLTALMLLSFLFTSCSAPDDEGLSAETTDAVTTLSEETKSKSDIIKEYLSALPNEKFDGTEINFLVASETLWGHEMIDADEISGEPINDERIYQYRHAMVG